jgi:hypothetical protein
MTRYAEMGSQPLRREPARPFLGDGGP